MSSFVAQLQSFFRTDTARLMCTYLAIIMAMSGAFSIVLYGTSTGQLERQRPPRLGVSDEFPLRASPEFRSFIANRIEEGKQKIAFNLIVTNIFVLLGGALLSYYLARRTLEPIEAAMEAQVQFVSDASHELRTPLTALRAGNEVALRRKNLTLQEAKQTIQDNIETTERLQQLTDGLLGLAANDAITPTQEISLQEVVAAALMNVSAKALEKDISVDDRIEPITLRADKSALIQLLTILLDNAVKYSPPESTITLSNTLKQKNHVVSIHVTDQGIGIDEKDAPHIFSRFYRADSSRSVTPGHGLGLPIAHKIAKAHNGVLSVESIPGEGSTFTIDLPINSKS